jgi:enamine deaminase RidA (YjgF/YER057c/UK114 family)
MQLQNPNIVWRRIGGALADEIYLQCRPHDHENEGIAEQTTAAYRAIDAFLRQEGASLARIVYETVLFRNIKRDFHPFQEARKRVFDPLRSPLFPASTFIEQPPLDTTADVAISAIALLPHQELSQDHCFTSPANGRSFVLGHQKHLYSGTIQGKAGSTYEQTYSMFCLADEVLAREGMNFRNVVRTWIYLRHMERDYGEFNRARREFFTQHGVNLLPASTGIYGSAWPEDADLILSFYAVKSPQPLETSAMTTPTLNEACTYGSDFSRGLRVADGNKIGLYISGTASVDEEGRTAHIDEFGPQVERMLLNIETLLAAQGASLGDLVSAITYLKNAGDAAMLQRILHSRGLKELPNAVVHAAVCRTDLLCEMEAIAVMRA